MWEISDPRKSAVTFRVFHEVPVITRQLSGFQARRWLWVAHWHGGEGRRWNLGPLGKCGGTCEVAAYEPQAPGELTERARVSMEPDLEARQ